MKNTNKYKEFFDILCTECRENVKNELDNVKIALPGVSGLWKMAASE
jgi:hypothetical protein